MNIEEYIASMDPDLRAGFLQMRPFFSSHPSDPVAARKWMAELLAATIGERPKNDQGTVENRSIPGPAGAPDVAIRIYAPTAKTGLVPGLLYIHGGGFTLGDLDSEDASCQHIVEAVGCVVVSAAYRLAPEHPFPAAEALNTRRSSCWQGQLPIVELFARVRLVSC